MTTKISWAGFSIGCLIMLPMVILHPASFGVMILWGAIFGYIVFGKRVETQ